MALLEVSWGLLVFWALWTVKDGTMSRRGVERGTEREESLLRTAVLLALTLEEI
ncbi:hypothetical protein BJX99DRAFT_255738 [Aspergillus californicus]